MNSQKEQRLLATCPGAGLSEEADLRTLKSIDAFVALLPACFGVPERLFWSRMPKEEDINYSCSSIPLPVPQKKQP